MSFIKQVRNARNKEMEENCTRVGYYLVHSSGRYFISETVSESALEKVCNKVLTDNDYQYWIDYSFGLDINRAVAWGNMDYTDRFI